jgi:mannose-6-phosphate isomerase-like protein (cupin superfamily)
MTVQKPWGEYKVLYSQENIVKVKELYVSPGKSLSMQKHSKRNEFWLVVQGVATVWTLNERMTNAKLFLGRYNPMESLFIKVGEWHQLENQGQEPLRIVEIQYGSECSEEDILRRS